MVQASQHDADTVLAGLNSGTDGLKDAQVNSARETYGLNVVSESHAPSLPATILGSFRNPFVLLLIVLAAIMVATNDHIGASTITVMVLISVGLNTTQEYKA